ncbi:MAG: MFS transporter [Mariprofundaceae bacterium]
MVPTKSLHHIRLFYASYFGGMGLLLPFFPVYLSEKGFDISMIGIFTGLLAIAKVVSPPLTGRALDHKAGNRATFISLATLAAALLMLLMPGVDKPMLLFFLIFGFGLLWSAVLPLTDGLSVAVSEAALADYGSLRVWGSIGFVVCTLLGGGLLADTSMSTFPYYMTALLLLTAYAAVGFPAYEEVSKETGHIRSQFSTPFIILLAAAFLMQFSHGAYYGFFSLYLLDIGYSGWQLGSFWTLGVLAEIVLMWGWSRPLQQAAPGWVLGSCFFLAALRWLGIGLAEAWWVLAAMQLMHAASFAAFHITAVTWVRRLAPEQKQASAQGWYSACGFGLGLTVGVVSCGVIAERFGFDAAFFVCAFIAMIGIGIAVLLSRSLADV